jgi:polar amino acid transport system substrate-binding protein
VSTADLKDKKIGVLLGSAHDAWAGKNYPNATILQYRTSADVTLAVKTGKVDAAIFDEVPLRDVLRDDPSLGMLGESLFSFTVGAGFNREATALLQQFNAFLADIKRNGVYAEMVTRWIEKRQSSMPAFDQTKTSGSLVVGVTGGGAPFSFVQDNQLIGFDIELVKRFGASIGKEVRLSDMEFGSLIAAVATKKVDLIAASIYITEERKKQINFSDPYYEMGNRVFALKSNIAAYSNQTTARPVKASFLTSLASSFRSNILDENRYLLLLDGLKTTVILSILSTVFGTVLGSVICFLRMSSSPWLNVPARLYITILRGMPVLVLLMLIFYVVFASVDISPILVAVIAFGMNFGAYASEIFRTGIEGIDKGQTEAGIAMGFTPVQSFLYIVLPQTVQRILPVYKGEFISLVKMTSIVGYIAVQDLTKASDIIRSRTFDAFFPLIMVSVLYFAISWILMQFLQYIERQTDPKYKRKQRGAA